MSKNIENQVYKILYQVLADAKTEDGMEIMLKSLLSESELEAISKRLAIAVFLDKGQSYEHIKDVLKVSSATIASVAENLNSRGLQQALTRVKAEEWADVWSIRISRALEKLMKRSGILTAWPNTTSQQQHLMSIVILTSDSH